MYVYACVAQGSRELMRHCHSGSGVAAAQGPAGGRGGGGGEGNRIGRGGEEAAHAAAQVLTAISHHYRLIILMIIRALIRLSVRYVTRATHSIHTGFMSSGFRTGVMSAELPWSYDEIELKGG